jgi:HAD superfamily hydrolase (TIGR01662 family)
MTSQEGVESKDEALSRVLRDAGHDVYFQEMWSARQLVAFIDYPRGRANTPSEYYAKVLERLEISRDARLIEELVSKDFESEKNLLYPDVALTVNALKVQGIKTAIVTTIARWRFEPLLRQNNVEIDFLCTAREAKAVKPNPKIYSAVLNKFEVNAEEAIMVGDDPKTDIVPAKKMGIKTVLLNREEERECAEADHAIFSLIQLLGLIKQ